MNVFLNRMLIVFFERVSPDSTVANPRCMMNTRPAAQHHPDVVGDERHILQGRARWSRFGILGVSVSSKQRNPRH